MHTTRLLQLNNPPQNNYQHHNITIINPFNWVTIIFQTQRSRLGTL